MLTEWWNRHGFTVILIISILFFVVCRITQLHKKSLGISAISVGFENTPKKKRNTRKTEDKCREIIERIFRKPFPSVRPSFLRNPETGKNLECDMMNGEEMLCVERQGEQHYKKVAHFHRDDDPMNGTFAKQLQRDALKRKLLAQAGFALIEIPYTVHYDSLEEYIPEVLSKYPKFKPYVDLYRAKK